MGVRSWRTISESKDATYERRSANLLSHWPEWLRLIFQPAAKRGPVASKLLAHLFERWRCELFDKARLELWCIEADVLMEIGLDEIPRFSRKVVLAVIDQEHAQKAKDIRQAFNYLTASGEFSRCILASQT